MVDYQREDMSAFRDKDTWLNELRRTNQQRTPVASETIRRTVPTDESVDRGDENAGSGETQPVYGTDGSVQSSEGSSNGVGEQLRSIFGESTGSNSSTYQHQPRARVTNPIRDTLNKYRDAVRVPKKETDKKTAAAAGSKKLSDTEVIKLRPKLIEFVLWQSEHADQLIIATTKGHDPAIEIWSNITRDEAEILTDYIISRGKVDARAAAFVRTASTLIDRLRLGIIILPRVYQTLQVYGEKGISIK